MLLHHATVARTALKIPLSTYLLLLAWLLLQIPSHGRCLQSRYQAMAFISWSLPPNGRIRQTMLFTYLKQKTSLRLKTRAANKTEKENESKRTETWVTKITFQPAFKSSNNLLWSWPRGQAVCFGHRDSRNRTCVKCGTGWRQADRGSSPETDTKHGDTLKGRKSRLYVNFKSW
jgi:hypothetical protein